MSRRPLVVVEISLGNKLMRGLWGLVWLLLYRPTPVPLHGWRRMLLRLFGARVGRGARPYPSATIWAPWNLEMKEGACIGPHVDCYSVAQIRIGRNATVSQYSYLCTASHDIDDASFPTVAATITIGDNAWVTADVFIGPGVHVGEGAVVGARSTLFHDVEAWTVVTGSPPKMTRHRKPTDLPVD